MTNYSISVTTKPAAEPLTIDEVKTHLRVDGAEFENIITRLIGGARKKVERTTGRRLITQTLAINADRFPKGDTFKLPVAPCQGITNIQYYDPDGIQQTFSATKYNTELISEPGRIVLVDGEVWPDIEVARPNAVTINGVFGYGDNGADIDEGIVTAMLMMIEKAFDRPDENYIKALDRVAISELSPYILKRYF